MRSNVAAKSPKVESILADYLPEEVAAAEIGIIPKTLAGYRKLRIGPEHVVVARRILYSRDSLKAWLAAGGTRGR